MYRKTHLAALLSALLFASPGAVLAATSTIPARALATDMGVVSSSASTSIRLMLKPTASLASMQALAQSMVDPSSPNYRRFLTPAQFKAQFGRSDLEIAMLKVQLQAMGLTVDKVSANNLMITAHGSNAQLSSAFGTPLHNYVLSNATFHAPSGTVTIPSQLSLVNAVFGLSNKRIFYSNLKRPPSNTNLLIANAAPIATTRSAPRSANVTATGQPGNYTVGDFANLANINPLYSSGMDGTGTTIAIATFANFDPSDAQAYWSSVGVNSDTSRISIKVVPDGGTVSSDGADETTLNVEQSGGIAPNAKIIVYEGDGDLASFADMFNAVAADNLADVVSMSWSADESDLGSADFTSTETALAQLLLQGIPVIVASGDSGAYNLARSDSWPNFTTPLTVGYPSSSPSVLSAGGMTQPITLRYISTGAIAAQVPQARAWGSDYLSNFYIQNYGQFGYAYLGLYSGGGGGVSSNFGVPSYQQNLPGMQVTAPGQSLICILSGGTPACNPGDDLLNLPAGLAGRNIPDVAFNADPYSGYQLYYQGSLSTRGGGTSFVAPQLNGAFALVTQQNKGRLGWLNPQLYSMFKTMGYSANSPFKAVTAGNNVYYNSTASFNPATGLGYLDITALANAIAPPAVAAANAAARQK